MRKTVPVQLLDDGQLLNFEITQMSATQTERWGLQAIFLLLGSAGELDFDIQGLSWQDIFKVAGSKGLSIFKGISIEQVQPLLDDLLRCCALVRDKARLPCTPETVDGYISDVKTLVQLRLESFKVNFPDFFTKTGATEAEKELPSRTKSGRRVPTLKIPHESSATPT